MSLTHRILIASDSQEAVVAIRSVLRDARGLELDAQIIEAHQPDPLYGVAQMPDILLLRVSSGSVLELEALSAYAPSERPPLIVIGDVGHPAYMRAAMQVGARDFLTEPVSEQELRAAISRIAAESRASQTPDQAQITAVVNGKGGSGATFLACNLANLLAESSQLRTVLLGVDLVFGSITRYLDIQPKRGLLEALEVAEDLDGTAIEAYLTRHDSGVALLASEHDADLMQQEMLTDRFDILLNLLLQNFEHCVIDVPRGIEPFSVRVFERADQIALVVQQSVPSLHDAARMYDLMTRNFGVRANRITIVVNRYQRGAAVELADIQEFFRDRKLICIPNDYRNVTESIDIGVPMYRHARRSAVTKALMQLEKQLHGRAGSTDKGFLPKLLRTG